MYSVKVEGNFSSAHNLRGYKGDCEELHGHNWKVELTVEKERLDKSGMVLDFRVLRNKLREVLSGLDHRYLNDIPYFRKINPTSENIAKYIFDKLKSLGVELKSVVVWESERSAASYYGK